MPGQAAVVCPLSECGKLKQGRDAHTAINFRITFIVDLLTRFGCAEDHCHGMHQVLNISRLSAAVSTAVAAAAKRSMLDQRTRQATPHEISIRHAV